jgi:hypothetical protein
MDFNKIRENLIKQDIEERTKREALKTIKNYEKMDIKNTQTKKDQKKILMKLFNKKFKANDIHSKKKRVELRNLAIDKAMTFVENGVKPDLEAIIEAIIRTL